MINATHRPRHGYDRLLGLYRWMLDTMPDGPDGARGSVFVYAERADDGTWSLRADSIDRRPFVCRDPDERDSSRHGWVFPTPLPRELHRDGFTTLTAAHEHALDVVERMRRRDDRERVDFPEADGWHESAFHIIAASWHVEPR